MNSITIAKSITEKHWDGYLPVDPVKIAKRLGIECNQKPEDFSSIALYRIAVSQHIAKELQVQGVNDFMVRLLVPRRIVEFMITQKNITTIEGLSAAFGTTQKVMLSALQKYRIVS